jgi:hypothetical protein
VELHYRSKVPGTIRLETTLAVATMRKGENTGRRSDSDDGPPGQFQSFGTHWKVMAFDWDNLKFVVLRDPIGYASDITNSYRPCLEIELHSSAKTLAYRAIKRA